MGKLSLERSPYSRFLLEDSNFRRWVSSMEEGSPNTAEVHFRRVGKVCTALNKKPRGLASMNRQEAKVFVQDVIAHLRSEGNIGSTIAGYVKALKSWLVAEIKHLEERERNEGAN